MLTSLPTFRQDYFLIIIDEETLFKSHYETLAEELELNNILDGINFPN